MSLSPSLMRRAKANLAASSFVRDAVTAPRLIVGVRKAKDGWRWNVKTRNGRIVAESGEAYTREADAQRAWLRFETLVKG